MPVLNVLDKGKPPNWLSLHLRKHAAALDTDRALRSAVRTGRLSMLEGLRERGVEVSPEQVKQAELNRRLSNAVDKHDLGKVKELLTQGADPNTGDFGLLSGGYRSFALLDRVVWFEGGTAHNTPEGRLAFEIGVELIMHGGTPKICYLEWRENNAYTRMKRAADERTNKTKPKPAPRDPSLVGDAHGTVTYLSVHIMD